MRIRGARSNRHKGPKVIIRRVGDPSDPRRLDHPSHREAWLRLADAIGRLEAREEINRRRGAKANEDG